MPSCLRETGEAVDGHGKPSTDGLYFVSAFGGLLAPHWRDDARATLVGLTLAHDKRHVSRAVLEGIAFQATDVVHSMVADTGGTPLAALRVDGGVSMSDQLLQYQARARSSPLGASRHLPHRQSLHNST